MTQAVHDVPLTPEERQLAIEEEMLNLGVERYFSAFQRQADRGCLHQTLPGKKLLEGSLDPFIAAIEQWLAAEGTRKTRKHPAYYILQETGADIAAALAARRIIDCLRRRPTYQEVSLSVGDGLEDEARYRKFAKADPRLHLLAIHRIKTVSHNAHRRRVMGSLASRAGVAPLSWAKNTKARLGSVLIELFKASTGIIEFGKRASRSGSLTRSPMMVVAGPGLEEWIEKFNGSASVVSPVHLPMVCPPAKWTAPRGGGYLSPAHKWPIIKRAKGPYLRELANRDLSTFYGSVNALQDVPWRVNRRVLEVIDAAWKGQETVAGLPPREDPPIPPKPHNIATDADARKRWKKLAALAHDKRARLRSKRRAIADCLFVARRFRNEEAIWFPYDADFRGRLYTKCTTLTPQGPDLSRGLLEFAEGRAIGGPNLDDETGVFWLQVHLANCWGNDKVSLHDRAKWTAENADRILSVNADPLEHRWWLDADQPVQFLAACFDFAGYVREGLSWKTRVPVWLDGTCSGLQHFSAAARDPVGARATNLVPAEKPNDIYADVAAVAVQKLRAIQSGDPLTERLVESLQRDRRNPRTEGEALALLKDVADRWLKFGVTRKTVKRPVMTLPYGSTLWAHRLYIEDHVVERIEAGEADPFGGRRVNGGCMEIACRVLSVIVWEAIGEVVVAARTVMSWLRESAKLAAKDNLPVSWVTPVGLPVVQARRVRTGKCVELANGDKVRWARFYDENGAIDPQAQADSLPPNWVHSLDAAVLMATTVTAADYHLRVGVVHDAYGTHCCDVERLHWAYRTSFVKIYRDHDVLSEMHGHFVRMIGDAAPPPPERGEFNISQVLDSDYVVS